MNDKRGVSSMRKWMAAGIAATLVGSVLAGCSDAGKSDSGDKKSEVASSSNVNPTGLPIVKEPITVTMMYPRQPNHGDFDKMWFFDEIAKRTNIHIKVQPVEMAGWEEKKALAFATGDLPDMFFSGLTVKDENTYGPQGMLINLKPLIDKYGTETKALFDKYPEVRKTFSTPEGAIYTVPTFSDYKRDTVLTRLYMNKSWLDNLGLKVPSNVDELYAALKAMKEQDPNKNGKADEIPLSGLSNVAREDTKIGILSAFGFVDPRHDMDKNKYVYVPMQSGYKEYLSYMNKLFKEGLIDKEFFSQKKEQLLAKEKNLTIGVTGDGGGYANIGSANLNQFIILPPLTSSINKEKMAPKQPAYQRWGTFAITSKSKHADALVRLVDYLFTLDGSIAMRAGPEFGKWNGNGGYEYVTVDGVKTFKSHFDGFPSFYNFRLTQTPLDGPFYNGQTLGDYLTYNDPQQVWLTNSILNSGIVDASRYAYPEVKFTPAEREKIASSIDIDNYVNQMEAKFIMGATPLTEWDNYIANLKKMGVDDMIKIRQDAYDRWNSIK